jgi:putative lipoprotein
MTRRALALDALLIVLFLGTVHCSRARETGGSDAQVTPSRPADSQSTSTELGGTSWRLVRFQAGDGTALTPDDRNKYTIAFGTDGRFSTRINCNRGMGTWKSSGPSRLELGPLALTRAMCLPEPLHDQMVKQLPYVRSYTIRHNHLFLSLVADGGTYEFEPMKVEVGLDGTVRGTATYRERMALPPNAVLEATLEDVSKTDAKGAIIGQTRVEHPRNPPIRFTIPFDPKRIKPNRQYAVRARILVDGKPFFATDQTYPVLTGGGGSEVELMLRRPAATAVAELPLEKTYWKLTELNGTAVTRGQNEPYLLLDPGTRRVSGSGGCNRLTGGYQLSGERLKLTQTVGTLMACMKGMETEQAFLKALGQVNGWRITGQQLELLDSNGKVLGRFEGRRSFD